MSPSRVIVDRIVRLGFGIPIESFSSPSVIRSLGSGRTSSTFFTFISRAALKRRRRSNSAAVDPARDQVARGAVDARDVGEIQPVGRVLRAGTPVAHGVDGVRALRPPAEPHVLVGIERQRGARMVHQVAADHVVAVGESARIFVTCRQQQQPRALDAIGCDDESLAA